MQVEKNIDTGVPNLYGKMSQYGRFLCINSPGDYYEIPTASLVFDCEKALSGQDCFVRFDEPATYNCTTLDGKFLAVGSSFSYITGGYEFSCMTIDPKEVMDTHGASGLTHTLPGTLKADFEQMNQPYGIYVNPYTGYIYGTDASLFEDAGYLYRPRASCGANTRSISIQAISLPCRLTASTITALTGLSTTNHQTANGMTSLAERC